MLVWLCLYLCRYQTAATTKLRVTGDPLMFVQTIDWIERWSCLPFVCTYLFWSLKIGSTAHISNLEDSLFGCAGGTGGTCTPAGKTTTFGSQFLGVAALNGRYYSKTLFIFLVQSVVQTHVSDPEQLLEPQGKTVRQSASGWWSSRVPQNKPPTHSLTIMHGNDYMSLCWRSADS